MLQDRIQKAIKQSINVDRVQMKPVEQRKLELVKKPKHPRVKRVNEGCQYAKYARFIVGKQMVATSTKDNSTTGWYEFVYDEDRIALNKAAGWSDNKRTYFLERPELC